MHAASSRHLQRHLELRQRPRSRAQKQFDVASLESYSLVAVTERETPLLDTAPLKPYVKGHARYNFVAVGPEDVKANFEVRAAAWLVNIAPASGAST